MPTERLQLVPTDPATMVRGQPNDDGGPGWEEAVRMAVDAFDHVEEREGEMRGRPGRTYFPALTDAGVARGSC